MKKIMIFLFAILFMQINVSFAKTNHKHEHNILHENKIEETYICPMHPDFKSHNKEDRCPICGMKLNKLENNSSETKRVFKENKVFRCPMHPNIQNSEKSSCPICGMDLIEDEVKKSEKKDHSASVNYSPYLKQTLGITFEEVKQGTLWQVLNTYGVSKINESSLSRYSLYTDGWIKKITKKRNGEKVKKGDFLYSIYSKELLNIQNDFLISLENKNNYSENLLKRYDISEDIILNIKKNRSILNDIPFFAKKDGIIKNLNVREGQHIKASEVIIETYSNENSWIEIYIPESKSNWMKVGTYFTYNYLGKEYNSTINMIHPELKNNSILARSTSKTFIPFNSNFEVKLYGEPINHAIHIPLESILLNEENNIVIVKENNELIRKNIKIGKIIGNRVEVLEGLKKGELVVTSSQFLLDSEISLKSGLKNIKKGS